MLLPGIMMMRFGNFMDFAANPSEDTYLSSK